MDLITPGLGLIVWQLVIFGLLFFLLSKFAWKPIMASLQEREQSIEDALRRFKRTVSKSGTMQEVRKREYYDKPSVKRKLKSEAARKRKF